MMAKIFHILLHYFICKNETQKQSFDKSFFDIKVIWNSENVLEIQLVEILQCKKHFEDS